jgi:hypothetical protein
VSSTSCVLKYWWHAGHKSSIIAKTSFVLAPLNSPGASASIPKAKRKAKKDALDNLPLDIQQTSILEDLLHVLIVCLRNLSFVSSWFSCFWHALHLVLTWTSTGFWGNIHLPPSWMLARRYRLTKYTCCVLSPRFIWQLSVRITNRLTSEIAEVPLTSTIIKIVNMDLVFILSLLSIKHRIFDPSLSSSPLSCSQPNCPKTCQIVMDSRYSIDTTFIHTAAHLISYPLSPFSVRRSVKPLRESRYSIPIQTPLPSASVFT